MRIKYLVIPILVSAIALNTNAQTTKTATPIKTAPVKVKTPVAPKPKPTSAEVMAMVKPVSGANFKDPAIRTLDFSTKVKPSEDFFEYVNQKWSKANPIPDDKANYGMFDKLDEQSRLVVKESLKMRQTIK